jgi:ribonucleoside-triphosphate reductase (thioredoxin)
MDSITQSYQFLSKYARWREENQRRETLDEAITRSMQFLLNEVDEQTGYYLTMEEYYTLRGAMREMKAFPSLRMFQMAGPAAERCNISIYNCSYRAIDSLQAFSEILYILMQGTGAGFSVERQFIDQLPSVVPLRGKDSIPWPIKDTTEGWCEALAWGMSSWVSGFDAHFDYSQIRPAGVRLKTK